MTKLSSGLEDYIEEIYLAEINHVPLRAAELARKLDISRASVSEALTKLVDRKLVNYTRYSTITLTSVGIKKAKEVFEKHHILEQFFEIVLGIDKKEASENACKIEHIVSQNILEQMIKFMNFCKENKGILEKYKDGI